MTVYIVTSWREFFGVYASLEAAKKAIAEDAFLASSDSITIFESEVGSDKYRVVK